MGRAWTVLWRYPKEGPVTFTTVVKQDSAYVYQKGRSRKLLGGKERQATRLINLQTRKRQRAKGLSVDK
jgi:hypothetical protein